MITTTQIQEKLVSYLAKEIAFADFRLWLVDHSWNVHSDGTANEARTLIDDLNDVTVDYLDGFINEDRLRDSVRPFSEYRVVRARFYAAPVAPGLEQQRSGSSGVLQRLGT